MKLNSSYTTYIALLRGINVSGQKLIKMTDLKALFETLNFYDVKTYIQSGNVIFRINDKRSKDNLAEEIEQAIQKQYSFHSSVILRTLEEWQTIIHENPFLKEIDSDSNSLYLIVLKAKPVAELIAKLEKVKTEFSDNFVISGEEIYLNCKNGYGKTKLNNNFFESKLKTAATTRNLKTVYQLLKLATGNN